MSDFGGVFGDLATQIATQSIRYQCDAMVKILGLAPTDIAEILTELSAEYSGMPE